MNKNIDEDFTNEIIELENGWIRVPSGEIFTPNDVSGLSAYEVYENHMKELENPTPPKPTLEEVVKEQENKISILTEELEAVTLANTRLQESTFRYMVTQNRLTLTSRYSADKVTFKVDFNTMSTVSERVNELDYDLFKLLRDNVLVGKDNYNYDEMINMLDFYQSIGFIDWDMWDEIFVIMELNLAKPEEAPEI